MANDVQYQLGWYDPEGVGITRALLVIPSGDAPIEDIDQHLAALRDAVQQSTGSTTASLVKFTTIVDQEPIP